MNGNKNARWQPARTTRRLPPFARELATALTAGRKPRNCVFIFAGSEAWANAKSFSRRQVVLLLPLGKDPEYFYWPIKGMDCLVGQKGNISEEELLNLAHTLLRNGATMVCVIAIGPDGEYATFHRAVKEVIHVA